MLKKSVLVVDDELDFLKMAESRLRAEGYKVITASNGKEAVELVKNNKPGIVFLDIQMPDIDGIETLRQIREFNKDIQVAIITAHGNVANWRDAIELNVCNFIPKGRAETNVTKTMVKILKRRRDL